MKKVGRQAFERTSAHRIFIESCDIHLLKSLQKFSDIFLLNRSVMLKEVSLHRAKLNAVAYFLHIKNVIRLVKY